MSATANLNGKSHICPIDQRRFATKASLRQHRAMVHGSAQSAPTRQGNLAARGRGFPRGRASRGRRGAGSYAGGTFSTRLPPSSGSEIVVSGEDRLAAIDITTNTAVIKEFPVDASFSPRLTLLARTYQRIQWLALDVNITAYASTMTTGGYIAGFVMDPEDRAVTSKQLATSPGTMIRKHYESSNVVMPKVATLFYTSGGNEPRFVSPGSFWYIVDGLPSSNIKVVLTARWKVRLSRPFIEGSEDPALDFFSTGKLVPKQNNYNLQFEVVKGAALSDDTSLFYPPSVLSLRGNQYWRVPSFGIEYSEGTGDTGTITAHFIVYNPDDKKTYYSVDGSSIGKVSWQGDVNIQTAVPCATYCKYAGSGNPCKPSGLNHQLSPSPDGENIKQQLTKLQETLDELQMQFQNLSSSSSVSIVDLPLE